MHHPGHWYGPYNVGSGNGAPSPLMNMQANEKKQYCQDLEFILDE